jgi:hypothetical protein
MYLSEFPVMTQSVNFSCFISRILAPLIADVNRTKRNRPGSEEPRRLNTTQPAGD